MSDPNASSFVGMSPQINVQLPDTFVVHGVAERDANELVCQFFDNEDDARAFMLDLPGRYEVERLSGIDYDALVVHHHASAAIGFVASAHVVVIGNVVDGCRFVGPFGSSEEAVTYGDDECRGLDWVVATLDAPKADEDFLVHKAEPYPRPTLMGPTCNHCNLAIKKVPGGQGPTWVHTSTGSVAGSGGPR